MHNDFVHEADVAERRTPNEKYTRERERDKNILEKGRLIGCRGERSFAPRL